MSITPPTAEEIRQFRQGARRSQAALAELLGVSTRSVEDWEAGRTKAPAHLRWAFAAIKAELKPWAWSEGSLTLTPTEPTSERS